MKPWLASRPGDGLLVIPAIDLLGGRAVRLVQGAYDRVREVAADAVESARRFVAAGAPALHVVDLDGARAGTPRNLAHLERIAAAAPDAAIQFGGGIRSHSDARAALSSGATAVIVGTRAVKDPAWVAGLLRDLGSGAVIGSLDLRSGQVAVEGWTQTIRTAPPAVWRGWRDAGMERAVVTDTTRDGTLEGVDADVFGALVEEPIAVAAAGGVARPEDLERLQRVGVAAVIAGLAFYRGGLEPEDLGRRGWRWRPEGEA